MKVDVRIQNGTKRFFITQFDGPRGALGGFQLLADTFENQHIGVHGHTHRQNDTCNAGQCQRRANQTEQAKDHANVDDQREIGKNSKEAIACKHEKQHGNKGHNGGHLARVDAVLAQLGANCAFFNKGQASGQGTGPQQNRQIGAFLNRKVPGDNT